MLYVRISSKLLQHQSIDQHAFTPGIRIEDALLCAEIVIEQNLEFNTPLWLMSIDMRKAFDTIEHDNMVYALRACDVPEEYISLIQLLYRNQVGVIGNSKFFPIHRQSLCAGKECSNCLLGIQL